MMRVEVLKLSSMINNQLNSRNCKSILRPKQSSYSVGLTRGGRFGFFRIVKGILFQLFIALVCSFTFAEERMRSWTSTDGRKLQAKFIEQVGIDGVEVETSTGAKVTLYKSGISKVDWEYVKKVSTKEVTDEELFSLPKALNGTGVFILCSVKGDVEVFENGVKEGEFVDANKEGRYEDGQYIEDEDGENKRASGKKASAGEILNIGAIVITGENSEAVILVTNGSLISIGENSRVVLDNLWQTQFTRTNQKINQLTTEPSQSRTSLQLDYGDMTVQVKKLNRGSSFSIRSPVGVAGVRGTKFRLSSRDDKSELSVAEGVVDYRDAQNKTFSVKQDRTLTAQKNINTSQKDLDDEEKKKIKESLAKASEDLAKYDLNKLGVEVQNGSKGKKNLRIPLIKDKLFLDMIWCPPGSFNDYHKQNRTIEKGFFLAKYELTTSQYFAISRGENYVLQRGLNKKPARLGYPESPTTKEFLRLIQARAMKSGLIPKDWNFTIPTKEEWVYACRAGTNSYYWWGNDLHRRWQKYDRVRGIRISSKFANYTVVGLEPAQESKEVGSYPPNPWGFYDMWGNASEHVISEDTQGRITYPTMGGGADQKAYSQSLTIYSPSSYTTLRVALKKIE